MWVKIKPPGFSPCFHLFLTHSLLKWPWLSVGSHFGVGAPFGTDFSGDWESPGVRAFDPWPNEYIFLNVACFFPFSIFQGIYYYSAYVYIWYAPPLVPRCCLILTTFFKTFCICWAKLGHQGRGVCVCVCATILQLRTLDPRLLGDFQCDNLEFKIQDSSFQNNLFWNSGN